MPDNAAPMEFVVPDADEAETLIKQMMEIIQMHGDASVHDLYDLMDIPGTFKDNQRGWKTMNGVHHHPTRGGVELVFPPPVSLIEKKNGRPVGSRKVESVKFSHEMPVELAERLDRLAAKMGTNRRGLMNVLLYQITEEK